MYKSCHSQCNKTLHKEYSKAKHQRMRLRTSLGYNIVANHDAVVFSFLYRSLSLSLSLFISLSFSLSIYLYLSFSRSRSLAFSIYLLFSRFFLKSQRKPLCISCSIELRWSSFCFFISTIISNSNVLMSLLL